MFNLLTVLVLLPIELSTRYLESISLLLVQPLSSKSTNAKEPELLNAITKPLTDSIIQIDKSVLDKIAVNQTADNSTLIKQFCKSKLIGHVMENNTVYQTETLVPCKLSNSKHFLVYVVNR